jgi:hypothetical protein
VAEVEQGEKGIIILIEDTRYRRKRKADFGASTTRSTICTRTTGTAG